MLGVQADLILPYSFNFSAEIPIWFSMLSTFSLRAFNILITFILNLLLDCSSIWAISKSGFDDHFVSWVCVFFCLFVCLTFLCFWKPDILSRRADTRVNNFYVWELTSLSFCCAFIVGIWIDGVGSWARCQVCGCYMVTLGALKVSSSSRNTLCLRWRLVGQRAWGFFPFSICSTLSFQFSFCISLIEDLCPHSHSVPLPEVFSCYLLLNTCPPGEGEQWEALIQPWS